MTDVRAEFAGFVRILSCEEKSTRFGPRFMIEMEEVKVSAVSNPKSTGRVLIWALKDREKSAAALCLFVAACGFHEVDACVGAVCHVVVKHGKDPEFTARASA